ncbi:hypothetical protein Trco_003488 [Trichoderma cornu-damae]|uniref:Uncharacterized protein n=1 Tax=Trichoderma cornu-damae TaxID=654480 RepID=A0A9P8QIV4_9HYPO|nr:hypothetical protein Trco_003488 [Trichoderma cornu-damae]
MEPSSPKQSPGCGSAPPRLHAGGWRPDLGSQPGDGVPVPFAHEAAAGLGRHIEDPLEPLELSAVLDVD